MRARVSYGALREINCLVSRDGCDVVQRPSIGVEGGGPRRREGFRNRGLERTLGRFEASMEESASHGRLRGLAG